MTSELAGTNPLHVMLTRGLRVVAQSRSKCGIKNSAFYFNVVTGTWRTNTTRQGTSCSPQVKPDGRRLVQHVARITCLSPRQTFWRKSISGKRRIPTTGGADLYFTSSEIKDITARTSTIRYEVHYNAGQCFLERLCHYTLLKVATWYLFPQSHSKFGTPRFVQ